MDIKKAIALANLPWRAAGTIITSLEGRAVDQIASTGQPDVDSRLQEEKDIESAALIVHCVNNFIPLLEALEEMLEGVELCTPDAPDPLPHSIIGRARAVIAAAKEVK